MFSSVSLKTFEKKKQRENTESQAFDGIFEKSSSNFKVWKTTYKTDLSFILGSQAGSSLPPAQFWLPSKKFYCSYNERIVSLGDQQFQLLKSA